MALRGPRKKTIEKQESLTHLTGRGGLGLVMFFLARKKIEFALTPERSPLGDIWVSVCGQKFGIEVKTTRDKLMWQIKRSQIDKVDFYALVSMDKAQCFVLTSAEMLTAIDASPVIYGDVHLVALSAFGIIAMNAWDKLDGAVSKSPQVFLQEHYRDKRYTYRHKKTVRKTLADGTKKIYTYLPYRHSLQPDNGNQ